MRNAGAYRPLDHTGLPWPETEPPMNLPVTHDVVIAGAGPVGLFLACELRLAGASVLVVEQADDPESPLKHLPFGMRGLSAPTIDALYRRGLLDGIALPAQAKDTAHWMQQARRPAGHFAGIQFFHDDIDTSQWPYHLPGPAGTHMATDMARVESVLKLSTTTMSRAQVRRSRTRPIFTSSLKVRITGVTLVRNDMDASSAQEGEQHGQ